MANTRHKPFCVTPAFRAFRQSWEQIADRRQEGVMGNRREALRSSIFHLPSSICHVLNPVSITALIRNAKCVSDDNCMVLASHSLGSIYVVHGGSQSGPLRHLLKCSGNRLAGSFWCLVFLLHCPNRGFRRSARAGFSAAVYAHERRNSPRELLCHLDRPMLYREPSNSFESCISRWTRSTAPNSWRVWMRR